MRRQNLPGACCDREHRRQNLASMRMASGFTSCRTIPQSNERRYGACSTRRRIHWRHDHARRYALGKLVCLAVGASRAGHRHPDLGLDPAATTHASAEAALTPHFRRRQTQTCSVPAPIASSLRHRFTCPPPSFAERDSPYSKPIPISSLRRSARPHPHNSQPPRNLPSKTFGFYEFLLVARVPFDRADT
jgi:hypothetical protein